MKQNLIKKGFTAASRSEYARAFLQLVCVQLAIVGIFVSLILWTESQLRVDLSLIGNLGLLLAMMFVSKSMLPRIRIERRLMELYPTAKTPGGFFLNVIMISPLTFLPIVLFLVLKPKGEVEEPMPFFFQRSRLVGAIVFGLLLFPPFAVILTGGTTVGDRERISSRLAFFSCVLGNPSSYYVCSSIHEIAGVAAAVRPSKDHENAEPFSFKPAIVAKEHVRSMTGAAILFAATAQQYDKQREGVVDRDKERALFLSFFGDVLAILEVWDQKPSLLRRLNVFYLFNPISMIEVTLLSALDQLLELKSRQIIIFGLKDKLESQNIVDAKSKDPEFSIGIDELQRKLHQTRSFKAMLNSKTYLFSP